jgi:hypothetical protein
MLLATRTTAAVTTAALALAAALGAALAHPMAAGAAVLGDVVVAPSAGSDATLFDGSVSAACPGGTDASFFSLEGTGLTPYEAFLGEGNATGTGAQSFSGASIANIETVVGHGLADGTYQVTFSCFAGSTATDTYTANLNYTGAGSGSFTITDATPSATAPGAPGTPKATAPSTGGSATVSWTAPANDGGSAVTSYTVQAYTGATLAKTVSGVAGTSASVTGLTNGTAYAFKVAAVNAVGTGAYSAASNAVTPRRATKLVLTSAPSLLTYGVAAKVVGKLTLANGTTAVSGQAVVLQVRKKGTSTYVSAASASTASTGVVTFTSYKPAYPVDSLRLVKSTAGAYLGSVSIAKAVSTQRRITAKWSAPQIYLGRTSTLSGHVFPRSSGLKVVLQRRSGTSWVTVTSKLLPSTTASYSSYAFAVKPTVKGTYYYRVVLAAAGGYATSVGYAPALKVV